MDKLIAAFPDNIREALDIASAIKLQKPTHEIRSILITGMGGSGIGGKIVSQWIQDEISVPVTLINDYNLPHFVNEYTLVIGSSYSGGTEETLISLEKAKQQGAHIICICSGGEIEQFCLQNNYDCIIIPGGKPPRTQLAYSVVQQVNIYSQLGFISNERLSHIKNSVALIEDNCVEIKEKAKELAHFLEKKVGIFYSASRYEGVAIRARQQFEENAKYLCWHHVIPEMNHNELVGWGGGDDRFAVVFIQTNDYIPRNQRRYEITKNIVSQKTAHVAEIIAKGENPIERSFYLIHLVDWSSFYLSEINAVDPMDIDVIYYLKGELAKFQG
ncbi:MAG: bifunctional phosphoglucose/phosphomannose isomerase [Bacteroidota bacterium]